MERVFRKLAKRPAQWPIFADIWLFLGQEEAERFEISSREFPRGRVTPALQIRRPFELVR
jgi:hypothetical protein